MRKTILNAKKAAALQGQTYNPDLGFATIRNVNGKPKYPYNPFYSGLSPRIAVAWTPWGSNTVIRGGYSRIYGRLNGVAQVLNPLLGASIAQPFPVSAPASAGVSRLRRRHAVYCFPHWHRWVDRSSA